MTNRTDKSIHRAKEERRAAQLAREAEERARAKARHKKPMRAYTPEFRALIHTNIYPQASGVGR